MSCKNSSLSRLPVLTSLNVTLFWVFSVSLRLGWTKSLRAPLDDAAIFAVALELNPRHAKIRRLGFVGSETDEKDKKVNDIPGTSQLVELNASAFY